MVEKGKAQPTMADYFREQAKRWEDAETKGKKAAADVEKRWRELWSGDAAKTVLQAVQGLQLQIDDLARAFVDANPGLALQARLAALERVVVESARKPTE